MNFKNIIGQRFGKLLVIELAYKHNKNGRYWLCQCDCGNTNIVSTHNLNGKNVLSCGCLRKEKIIENFKNKRENLIGKKFSFLTVISYLNNSKWNCKCDCGNTQFIIARTSELIRGKIKSCGCYRKKRLEYGENAFNRLYGTYQRRAIDKKLDFDLSKEDFKILTQKNCLYCGCEPKQIAKRSNERCYGEYVYNGLDRVDNTKGYTKNNVFPCCGQCNVAKNNYSKKEFVDWIIRTYKNIISNSEIFNV